MPLANMATSPSFPAADPLLAMFTDCESSASGIFATVIPALASLTADMVARSNESLLLALAQVAFYRSALLARKTRVLGSANRLSCKLYKRIVADFEAADVSTEQLRVWAAVAGAGPDLDGAIVASPLLASPRPVQCPAICVGCIIRLRHVDELGSVATGDGLRVVSAAGPGLRWFEPHSRNEFSVVLAQADGGVPVWLTAGDVAMGAMSLVGTPAAVGARVGAAAAVRSEWVQVQQGTVSVMYGGLSEDAPEAVLLLSVCGVPVTDTTGDCDWCVRVPRKPLAGHECAALGTHVTTLAVAEGYKFGLAVSADEKWMVVGMGERGTLSVFSLPRSELVRTFGGRGNGPLLFKWLYRLCFAPNCNLIVVDGKNGRLQEVTLDGVFVRFIGVGEFGVSAPYCVAVHDDVIAVGCMEGTGPRVVLFDFGTGAMTSCFGEMGTVPGHLSKNCSGIQFTPDGSHVIVAEYAARLSLFTTAGVFVRCVGVGVLGRGCNDVLQSVSGEYVVADVDDNRVCVFSTDGSELVRSWDVEGADDLQPTALAAAGQHFYVMGGSSGRAQVFS